MQGWAEEEPITYPDAFIQYDVELNTFSHVPTYDDSQHDDDDDDGTSSDKNGTDSRPTPRWYHSYVTDARA